MYPSSSPGPGPLSRTQKRQYQLDDSSDFFFSSDPPSPDAAVGPRKRVYRGTWWAGSNKYERNFDSGVFMASDDSLPNFESSSQFVAAAIVTPTTASPAHIIVDRAIENGDPVVDLSDLQLSCLPNDVPIALQSLVKQPRFDTGSQSPDEHEYRSLASQIQLYLANNTLNALPPSLWSLENLTVLSIRNNGITSIPSGIAKLSSLEELNLANNKLRWLPWELLQLLGPGKSLTKLHVRPNPFFVGVEPNTVIGKLIMPGTVNEYQNQLMALRTCAGLADEEDKDKDLRSRWLHKLLAGLWQTMETVDSESLLERGPKCLWDQCGADFALRSFPIAISKVSYFRNDGTLQPTQEATPPSRSAQHIIYQPADPHEKITEHVRGSRVPSLLELAMGRCAASLEAERRDLEDLLPSDAPTPVLRAICETYETMAEGGRVCTSCSRRYIIPRTEWIEYWHCIPKNASAISSDEMFWPFLRRGCSWACVP
jgi:hypothetical protein